MLNPDKKFYLEDVIEMTGISERNIKFWVAEYRLKVIKEGRKNLYPAQTVTLLNLIRDLSEYKFFTTKFIQVQVERCKDPHNTNIHGLEELNAVTQKMLQYVFEMNSYSPEPETVIEREVGPAAEEAAPETFAEIAPGMAAPPKADAPIETAKPKHQVVDDFAWSKETEEFQPVPTQQNDSMRRILKDLRSPIISLADEPRDKKHSFWQQLKKILK